MGAVTKLVKRQDVSEKIKEVASPVAQSQAAMATTREASEDLAARRRARRSARALLSENRLNPEQGVTTLGSVTQ